MNKPKKQRSPELIKLAIEKMKKIEVSNLTETAKNWAALIRVRLEKQLRNDKTNSI